MPLRESFSTQPNEKTLFGGEQGWNAADWTASDDRVRGGKSQSYLDTTKSTATFSGNLDIKTLGGAGFASQRTTTTTSTWDLSSYSGIKLSLGKADDKRYTLILKDELLPPNSENGREQATISYEYDFKIDDAEAFSEEKGTFAFVKWDDLRPTYRGKEKKDAKGLNPRSIKRFSIMIRSFFGDQDGDFDLSIKSIEAVTLPDDEESGFAARGNGIWTQALSTKVLATLLVVTVATYAVCLWACPSLCPRPSDLRTKWRQSR